MRIKHVSQETMVNGTTCTVILLTKSSSTPYQITKTMHVHSSKIIIGHPIDIPIIRPAKGVERMFDGETGGRSAFGYLHTRRNH